MQRTDSGLVGAADALTVMSPAEARAEAAAEPDTLAGSALYDYISGGTINGIAVDPCDRGLPIDREDVLGAAFELVRVPHIAVIELGGGYRDSEYKEIMDRVYGGSAIVVSEERTYDQAKGCYVVLLRYDDASYRLCGRYRYLKEQLQ